MYNQFKVVKQWNDIKKAVRDSDKKAFLRQDLSQIIHSRRRHVKCKELPKLNESQPEVDSDQPLSILFLRDTTRNTRRTFHMSQRKRQQSFQKDQEFFEKVTGRKEEAEKHKILYSNITRVDQAVKKLNISQANARKELSQVSQVNQVSKEQKSKPESSNEFISVKKLCQLIPNKSDNMVQSKIIQVESTTRDNFWGRINIRNNEFKDSITKQLKRRLVPQDDVKLSYRSFNYESLRSSANYKQYALNNHPCI